MDKQFLKEHITSRIVDDRESLGAQTFNLAKKDRDIEGPICSVNSE
jgi:hypothetical protein